MISPLIFLLFHSRAGLVDWLCALTATMEVICCLCQPWRGASTFLPFRIQGYRMSLRLVWVISHTPHGTRICIPDVWRVVARCGSTHVHYSVMVAHDIILVYLSSNVMHALKKGDGVVRCIPTPPSRDSNH